MQSILHYVASSTSQQFQTKKYAIICKETTSVMAICFKNVFIVKSRYNEHRVIEIAREMEAINGYLKVNGQTFRFTSDASNNTKANSKILIIWNNKECFHLLGYFLMSIFNPLEDKGVKDWVTIFRNFDFMRNS